MITETVSCWTTGTSAFVRSLFPIPCSVNGSVSLYCPQIRSCTPRFTKRGICAVAACAVRPLLPDPTGLFTARTAGSVSPADRPPSAWGNCGRMWRGRGEISLDLCGFPGGKIRRQGIYTFTPENGVLLRNKPISAPMKKSGRGGCLIAAASRFSFILQIWNWPSYKRGIRAKSGAFASLVDLKKTNEKLPLHLYYIFCRSFL